MRLSIMSKLNTKKVFQPFQSDVQMVSKLVFQPDQTGVKLVGKLATQLDQLKCASKPPNVTNKPGRPIRPVNHLRLVS